VSEDRVPRKICGAKWEDVTHNEECQDLHCSSNIIRPIESRRMQWAGHVECMHTELSLGNAQVKRSLVRHKPGWKDSIKMDYKEIRW
jgi:hypothetical protein